jgi:hypothetical protein
MNLKPSVKCSGSLMMRASSSWICLLLVFASIARAQSPTPAQGRDYSAGVYRVVRVDSMGRLEVVASGGSGCPGTVGTPCVVEGVSANGAAVAGSPVQMGGSDGALVRYILVDTSGRIINVGAAADGAALAGNPLRIGISDGTNAQNVESASTVGMANNGLGILATLPAAFNGSTFQQSYVCPNPVGVSVAASGTTQIVALSGTTRIRVCGVYLTTASSVNVSLTRGTGSNCGTGTAALGGVYQVVSSISLDFGPSMALTTNAGDALCLTLSGAVSTTGTVIYAQF